ncbi:MAG: sulfatase [Muribaculaceae bacterium]
MKKHSTLLLLCSPFALHQAVVAQEQSSSLPNIVLIMADDLGWGDVGFNGNPHVKTPCLDRLSSEGVVFDHFYSAAPLSSPTRASVLTGRNAYRMGVFAPNVGILRPEEKSLPLLLKTKGYVTGHFGKWHLGTLTCREVDANRGRPENKHLFNPPSEHGYDDAFVTESKVPTYDPMSAPVENNGRFWDYLPEYDERKNYGTYYWDIHGNKVTEGLRGDDSRIIVDRTLPFIDRSLKEGKPFLATVWFHAPHLPCVAGPEHTALYSGLSLEERNYYGCITAMDEQIERLVGFLKQKGVYDNTIIFFCSDNGPELNTPGTAGAFKGKKRSLHEGGVRVPSLMVGGKGMRHKHVSQPCTTSDYLPTILQLTGISQQGLYELDGESFLPFIQSEKAVRTKPLVFCSGTQGAVVAGDYKLYYDQGKCELYRLSTDPTEQNDLSASQPEETKRLFDCLYRQIDAFRRSFEGEEYGTSSVKRMNQRWEGIFNEKEKAGK